MKKIILIALCIITISLIFGKSIIDTDSRTLINNSLMESGNYNLNFTNFGCMGEFSNMDYGLEYPRGSGVNYLYQSAFWVAGKKYRRNSEGIKLYWKNWPPVAQNDYCVQGDEYYNSHTGLQAVIDTLTTVGFDGDADLFEMLPAYNTVESNLIPNYAIYNTQDNVLTSILGYPHPRDFSVIDPQNTWCFTQPVYENADYPGFETKSSFSYDYSPFNNVLERDYGSSCTMNTHIPLGIAIVQQAFTWPVQNYANMCFIKTRLYNSSTIDTLFDLALSNYVDADCGSNSGDDKSGYDRTEGHEFAFSYDSDSDNGVTPGYIGSKVFYNQDNAQRSCWYWKIGNGPHDNNPLSLTPSPRKTANEKYWLMTSRNPDETKFTKLRKTPTENPNPIFNQPDAVDTRFLNSFCGAQPGTPDYNNPNLRWNLAPGQFVDFYTVIFLGNSLEELQELSVMATDLYNSNFNPAAFTGLPSLPYLYNLQSTNDTSIKVKWYNYNQPEETRVYWKEAEAPASTWQYTVAAPQDTTMTLSNLTYDQAYKVKIVGITNLNGTEPVYLESSTKVKIAGEIANEDDISDTPEIVLSNYPNPFNPETTISFNIPKDGKVELAIFNIKGQKIKTLVNESKPRGSHTVTWNGKSSNNKSASSGVYFYKLTSNGKTQMKKMLLMK